MSNGTIKTHIVSSKLAGADWHVYMALKHENVIVLIDAVIGELMTIDNAVNTIAEMFTHTVLPQKMIENKTIMAYKMDNVNLARERGLPFQLVAESKWGYKWKNWKSQSNHQTTKEYM
ncbi:MAG: molybdopterin-dependent oxidoreductase [Candidatus Bathyarchaeota archaeon]|nr:molybdopterin-dependent oxidoreductase [Candidatus Bathyarchaeota archaeon]